MATATLDAYEVCCIAEWIRKDKADYVDRLISRKWTHAVDHGFACVTLSVEDVQAEADDMGLDLDWDDARMFLQKHERRLYNAMVVAACNTIAKLLQNEAER